MLSELRREAQRGAVVVVATHDPAVVAACDAHFMLDEGRVVDHIEAVHLDGARHRHPHDEHPTEQESDTAYAGRHSTPEESPAAQESAPAIDPVNDPVTETEETDDWAFRRPADD